ncbi:MAG: hypothetical protein AAB264_00605, partial [Planctomycetota bacterium]
AICFMPFAPVVERRGSSLYRKSPEGLSILAFPTSSGYSLMKALKILLKKGCEGVVSPSPLALAAPLLLQFIINEVLNSRQCLRYTA